MFGGSQSSKEGQPWHIENSASILATEIDKLENLDVCETVELLTTLSTAITETAKISPDTTDDPEENVFKNRLVTEMSTYVAFLSRSVHGFSVSLPWRAVELPADIKRFLNPTGERKPTLNIESRITHTPIAPFEEEILTFGLQLAVNDRKLRFNVIRDFHEDGHVVDNLSVYSMKLDYLRPSSDDPNKMEEHDKRNLFWEDPVFNRNGVTFPRDQAIAIAKVVQFALRQTQKQQELQNLKNWS